MDLRRTPQPSPYEFLPPVPAFEVTSNDVSDGQPVALAQVHDSAGGENRSPHLSWSGFPSATKSFAITVFDPDAPTGCGWWHWQVVNIPASTTTLRTGASPAGLPEGAIEFRTDFGVRGYQGSAPPPGDQVHRYFIAVHALDVDHLDLAPGTPNAIVGFNLTAHTLARGIILGTYQY